MKTIIRNVFGIGLCFVYSCSAGQERIIIDFEENETIMIYDTTNSLKDIVFPIAKVLEEENVKHFSIYLIVRSSQQELESNKYIGVSRALIVRDSLINVFTRFTSILPNYSNFYITDLGIQEERGLHGVQISVMLRD